MARGPWHEEVDLVVVGASVGGLAAAVMAADRGCRTIVVERSKELGGGAATEAEMIAAAGSRWQRAAGIDDGPERLADDVLAATHRLVEPELAAALAAQGAPLVAWLADRCGAQVELFHEYVAAGHSVARLHGPGERGGAGLSADLARAASRHSHISVRSTTVAERLVRDDPGARRLPPLRRAHGGRSPSRRPVLRARRPAAHRAARGDARGSRQAVRAGRGGPAPDDRGLQRKPRVGGRFLRPRALRGPARATLPRHPCDGRALALARRSRRGRHGARPRRRGPADPGALRRGWRRRRPRRRGHRGLPRRARHARRPRPRPPPRPRRDRSLDRPGSRADLVAGARGEASPRTGEAAGPPSQRLCAGTYVHSGMLVGPAQPKRRWRPRRLADARCDLRGPRRPRTAVDEREEQLVERGGNVRGARRPPAEVVGPRAPAAQLVAVDGKHVATDAEVGPRGAARPGRHPKNTDRRRRLSRTTISWMVRRTRVASCRARCHRASTSCASSRIGLPNRMNHLVGRGSAPSTPSRGKKGVTGT